jgi:hypothetical protein
MNASIWGTQLARAQGRAQSKYPTQPERARRMVDSEMGHYNGPYTLEPLTTLQMIQKIFGKTFDE